MHPTLAALLRPIASLALAVALVAPVALAPEAHAQFGRQLPSPISAAQLEQMLRDSGLPDTTKDAALPLHEAYFERFRDFEKRELDPLLSKPNDKPFDLVRSVEDAKKEADLRRRAFQRAAQFDNQLADEIGGVLLTEDAWRTSMLKAAMSRRRSAMLGSGLAFSGKPLDFSLRSAPVLATLDPDTRRMANLSIEVYEAELTRQLERYAEASFARIVKAAEIREEMGLTMPPAAPEDGQPNAAAPGEEWFQKMQEVQRRAGEDVTKITARIRKLHREGLDQVMPILPAVDARALRDHMISQVYPMLRAKSDFDPVYEQARKMHAEGKIDDSKWASVTDIAEANEHSGRPVILAMMDLIDKRVAAGEFGVITIGEGGDDESREKMESLRAQLRTLEENNAVALRTLLGINEPEKGDGRGVERQGINLADVLGGGGAEVAIGSVAIMAGGDGEAIVLSGDDMGEGGFFLGGFGGGDARVPKPMTREDIDVLAKTLGFADDARPVFDEIVARAAETRNVAEQELKPARQIEASGDEGGGMTMTFTIGDGGEMSFGGGGDNTALIAAIEKAEETMFDELKAAAAADKGDAVEAARRARARVRLLPGETGVQAVDIVSVSEKSALAEGAAAKVAPAVRAWDEASVNAIRSMKAEIKRLEAERQEVMQLATKEVTDDDGNGSVNVSRSVQIDGEQAKKLEDIERRIGTTRNRVGDANKDTLRNMLSALDGDDSAQTALRRAFYRAANPSVYRTPRDLEPFFTKAAAIAGLSDSGKKAVASLRAEWIEARESRCEEFVAAQEKRVDSPGLDPGAGMQQMQARQRERKKLREDLEQVESTMFRKLQDALIVDVGADKAKEIGELPARKRPQMPTIQFGG